MRKQSASRVLDIREGRIVKRISSGAERMAGGV